MGVLLVEDDELARQVFAAFLTEAGMNVREAGTAEEGLFLIESAGPPRIIVTDIELGPGMTGLLLGDVVARRWGNIGVVFISGQPWLMRSHVLRPRERFLGKPFRAQVLLDVIRELRGQGNVRATLSAPAQNGISRYFRTGASGLGRPGLGTASKKSPLGV